MFALSSSSSSSAGFVKTNNNPLKNRRQTMGMMMFFGGFFSKTDAVFASSLSSAKKRLVSDGYSIELEEKYTAEESKGVSTSTQTIKDESGNIIATIRSEPTGTMGNYGLQSMFANVDEFGEKMKGRYKNADEDENSSGESNKRAAKELEGSGMYAIELSGNRVVGIVVGCKDGENGRKFNQMQTISAFAQANDERKKEEAWSILESLRLTTGKTCSG
jgi:hypothetical protein